MVKIDMSKRIVTVDGIPIELTSPQWDILEHFSPTEGVTIEKVAQRVYGSQSPKNRTTTSVTVSRIKKIVGDPDFIVKGRGSEYILHSSVEVIEKGEILEESKS